MKTYLGKIPNSHVRDFQRNKVYSAEAKCLFWANVDLLSLEEVKETVEAIATWASIPIPIVDIQGQEDLPLVYATATEIVLPSVSEWTLPCICHEMAHVINYNSENADHHGKYFTTVYLSVVKQFIGLTAYRELQEAFDWTKVIYLTSVPS